MKLMSSKGLSSIILILGVLIISGLIAVGTLQNTSRDLKIDGNSYRLMFYNPKGDYISVDANGGNKKSVKLEYNPSSDLYISPSGSLVAAVSLWGDEKEIELFNFKDSTVKTIASTSSNMAESPVLLRTGVNAIPERSNCQVAKRRHSLS